MILLIYGIGTFIGNSASSCLLERSMPITLAMLLLLMLLLAVALTLMGGDITSDTIMVAALGRCCRCSACRLVKVGHENRAR